MKAKAENFGELDLQLTKLRGIRWLNAAQELDVTIDAAKFGNQGQWMDTNFEVRDGMRLHIDASGNVNLFPQNAGFVCGPGGILNGGKAPGTNFNAGALLGPSARAGPCSWLANIMKAALTTARASFICTSDRAPGCPMAPAVPSP